MSTSSSSSSSSLESKEKKEEKYVRGLDDEGLDGPIGGEGPKEVVEEKKLVPSEQLTISTALGALASRDLFADITFIVGTGEDKRSIPAHRIIMAAGSDIFEAMLFPPKFPGDEKDRKEEKLPKEIVIPDVRPHIFRLMLQCIYSDTAQIKAEDLPDLIACANKFQLESLRSLCLTFMEEGVTADNACKLFETADKLLSEKSLALNFIEENTEEVARSPGWDTLPKDRLIAILDSNKLAIDEVDLFRATSRWASCELKRQALLDTPENKRLILADVLTKIRFPTMTMEDVATWVSPSGILTSGQLLEIFTYVGAADKLKTKKPTWPTQARAGSKEKWVLDTEFKSSTITLSQGNLTISNSGSTYGYALGSTAWNKGKHAWRVIRDTNPTSWLFLGVSRKTSHQNASYNDATTWGLSSASQRYFQGSATSMTSNFNTGPMDVVYDADAGTLTIINVSNAQKFELTGLPTGTELCPHFCPNGTQQLSVYPINPREAGSKTLTLKRTK